MVTNEGDNILNVRVISKQGDGILAEAISGYSGKDGLQYIVDWDEQGNVNIYIKTPDQVIKSLDLEAAVRVQIIETKFKLWYF
jgi:hypothetical protein